MNATSQYLRSVSTVAFEAQGLTVTLKDGTEFNGSLAEFKEFARRHGDAIAASSIGGYKVGIFPALVPSSQRQRDWLAGRLGVPVAKNVVKTFRGRLEAKEAVISMRACGVPVNPEKNLRWVLVDTSNQEEATA